MTTFIETQQKFIAHIKDPENHPYDDGVDDRRMQIYRELFFNNILGFLSSGFPVLESLYSQENWIALARRFFAEHHCRSPYFVDISKEFVEFLSNEYNPSEEDVVFLKELAHYEWLELDISVRKVDAPQVVWDTKQDFDNVQMSQCAELVSYVYPVHQISPDFIPSEEQEPTYIVVYRNDSDDVKFTLVNAVTAHMLNIISQSSFTKVSQLIEQMCDALPQIDSEIVSTSTMDTLKEMLALQVLVIHLD